LNQRSRAHWWLAVAICKKKESPTVLHLGEEFKRGRCEKYMIYPNPTKQKHFVNLPQNANFKMVD
jgi:hypothetical protein